MVSTFSTTSTKVRLKPTIEIPAEDHDTYVRLAEVERKPVDQVLSERLTDCSSHNAVKGIWLGDKDREALEQTMGANFSNAASVIHAARKCVTVRIGTVEVRLKPQLLERLRSRCFSQDFDKWLSAEITAHLEQFTNLR